MDAASFFRHIFEDDKLTFQEKTAKMIEMYKSNPLGLEALDKYGKLDKALREQDIIKFCLKTGDQLPSFTLPNQYGEAKNIYELHQTEWLVLVYFRGKFCPFCNLDLRILQKKLKAIEGCPAQLVAISPQTVENSLEMAQNNQLSYNVLSDAGFKVGMQFRLIYEVPDYLMEFHKKLGVSQEYFNELGKMELPMPATYLIDKTGLIRFHHIETNAALRLPPDDIIKLITTYSLKTL